MRPKRSFLEVCLFLGRAVKAPQVRRADRTSKTKVANILQITHRDEVEAPCTDWLQEAYELPDVLAAKPTKAHSQGGAEVPHRQGDIDAAVVPTRRTDSRPRSGTRRVVFDVISEPPSLR